MGVRWINTREISAALIRVGWARMVTVGLERLAVGAQLDK